MVFDNNITFIFNETFDTFNAGFCPYSVNDLISWCRSFNSSFVNTASLLMLVNTLFIAFYLYRPKYWLSHAPYFIAFNWSLNVILLYFAVVGT